jgi:hypothetical protein
VQDPDLVWTTSNMVWSSLSYIGLWNSREMSHDSNGLNSAPRRFGNLVINLG